MNFLQSVFGSKQPGTVEQGGTAPGSGNVSGGASRQAFYTAAAVCLGRDQRSLLRQA